MIPHKLSSTIPQILNILNDGRIHTGIDIGNDLGISRTAVWKVIKRLQKYNIDIQSQHKGYYLKEPLILLDQRKIEPFLADKRISLEIFETLESTSHYLKSIMPLENQTVCLSEYQSMGRGRLGRRWLSPFGHNIYCSLSSIFKKDIVEMSGLSLVVAVLTANALESFNPRLKVGLKWPNDLYMNNQKLGGILIELMGEAYGNCQAIIGIGLNVNMKDIKLAGLDQPWISLEHITQEKLDRNFIVGYILRTIFEGLDVFQHKGLEAFLPEWEKYDLLRNQKVSLNTGAGKVFGIARGVDSQGLLLVEDSTGSIQKFSYGDASLFKD
ncbi:MAG: biotin--[acetyl-CoA-carboxylase] ligase [Caedibacter sp. 37-49]|nr:MAG: biotin--[acetyl-CoA-carboxylase] ligase [Caedibacter sp. 37-49]